MARRRVEQEIFLFHAEGVHARNNRPGGTLFRYRYCREKRPPWRGHRRPNLSGKTADGAKGPSAIRLSAARGVDLFLQRIEADRADHHIIADNIAWRPVEAECLGKLEVLLQCSFYLRACHVLVEPGHVEPDVL